jgi:two-component system LytT family sensor kinase
MSTDDAASRRSDASSRSAPLALRPFVAISSGVLVNLASWLGVAVLLAEQTYLVRLASGVPSSWGTAFRGTIGGCLAWAALTPAILRISERLRVGGPRSLLTLAAHLVVGSALCAADARFNMLLSSLMQQPAAPFRLTFLRLYPVNITCYLAVVAVGHAIGFARMYRERAVAEARLAAELSTARLRMLESQLRPHFLFNTLNAIAEQVHSNPTGADEMILQLGALLRASLQLSEGHEIPLRDEVETLGHYLAIVRARYADRLAVRVDVSANAESACVPAMILQPLIENALQHGVEPLERLTHVWVTARRYGDDVLITVGDDGAGFSGALSEGVGLRNTRARLQTLYGDAASLTLMPRTDGGTIAEVRLPMANDA